MENAVAVAGNPKARAITRQGTHKAGAAMKGNHLSRLLDVRDDLRSAERVIQRAIRGDAVVRERRPGDRRRMLRVHHRGVADGRVLQVVRAIDPCAHADWREPLPLQQRGSRIRVADAVARAEIDRRSLNACRLHPVVETDRKPHRDLVHQPYRHARVVIDHDVRDRPSSREGRQRRGCARASDPRLGECRGCLVGWAEKALRVTRHVARQGPAEERVAAELFAQEVARGSPNGQPPARAEIVEVHLGRRFAVFDRVEPCRQCHVMRRRLGDRHRERLDAVSHGGRNDDGACDRG